MAIRRRRAIAFHVLVAFVGGFLLLPCLHNLGHRDDHQHGPDGFSVRWDPGGGAAHVEAHRRGRAHAHTQVHPGTAAQPPRPGLAPPEDAAGGLSHGHGSAAHFGVAALAAPTFFWAPPPAPSPEPAIAPLPEQRPPLFSFAVAQPRGPPSIG